LGCALSVISLWSWCYCWCSSSALSRRRRPRPAGRRRRTWCPRCTCSATPPWTWATTSTCRGTPRRSSPTASISRTLGPPGASATATTSPTSSVSERAFQLTLAATVFIATPCRGLTGLQTKISAKLLGFKRSPPAYLSLTPRTSRQILRGLRGVNYASGGSGILDTTVSTTSTTDLVVTHS
jgi:hypothetical protein